MSQYASLVGHELGARLNRIQNLHLPLHHEFAYINYPLTVHVERVVVDPYLPHAAVVHKVFDLPHHALRRHGAELVPVNGLRIGAENAVERAPARGDHGRGRKRHKNAFVEFAQVKKVVRGNGKAVEVGNGFGVGVHAHRARPVFPRESLDGCEVFAGRERREKFAPPNSPTPCAG